MAKVASRAPRSRLVISDPDAKVKRKVVPYTEINKYTAGQIASHPAIVPYNPRRYQDDNPNGVNRAAKGLTSSAPAQSSDLTKRGRSSSPAVTEASDLSKRGRSSSPALSKGPASEMSYQGQQGDAATKRGAVTSYQANAAAADARRMDKGSKREEMNRERGRGGNKGGGGRKEGRN